MRRLIVGAEVEGVFTLFAILFTLLGIAMAGLGIVGEYVGRIYQQVRGRPRFRDPARLRAAGGSRRARVAGRWRESALGASAMTRIAVFAYSDTGHACLKHLLERGAHVVLVATHRDAPERGALVPERRGARPQARGSSRSSWRIRSTPRSIARVRSRAART